MTYMPRFNAQIREILEVVQAGLNELKDQAEVAQPILNIHGISGIGKTHLIWQMFDQFTQNFHVIWLGFRVTSNPPRDFPSQKHAWSDVIDQLRHLRELENLPDTLTSDKQESMAPETVYVRYVSSRGLEQIDQRPLLLLLDGLDSVHYWKWLQSEIIKPLVAYSQALIICTSRAPLFWNFWELREQQREGIELDPFDLEETKALIRDYKCEPLAQTLRDLTGGYPLALRQYVNLLTATRHKGADDAEQDSLDTSLEANYLGKIKIAIKLAAVMRRIEQRTLKALFGRFRPEERLTFLEWLQVLSVFQESGHTKPYSLTQADGLICRSVLRKNAVRLLEPEISYVKVCQELATIYQETVSSPSSSVASQGQRQPKEKVDAFVEWLYFSTELPDSDEEQVSRDKWRERWLKHFNELKHHVQATGILLAVQFYRDSELIDKLDKLKLLDLLHDFMRECLAGKKSYAPIRNIVDTSCDEVMTILAERLPTDDLSLQVKNLLHITSLRTIFKSDSFDVTMLGEHSRTKAAILPKSSTETNTLVAVLKSWGLLFYDREHRTYRPHGLLRELEMATIA